ncbi:hypothetical protein E8E14_013745 [Neopestalotiopsis sp. 37M]|nr:hypothetical protein E8E14_013745 [Neopestalotiopsis sp. 37M]
MDWGAEEAHIWDQTVTIALIKYPANVSTSDTRYGGEIYINPGGPGVSGVEFALRAAESRAELIGPSNGDAKQFDIVGFDPRGVMHSTPRPTCFANLRARQLWYHTKEGYEVPTDSNRTPTHLMARAAAFRKLCNPSNTSDGSNSESLKWHMTSAHVARDLLAIVDKSAEAAGSSSKGMLQYWGVSYGTTLGGYFASLFPERVERMVLDGNSNFEHWLTGNRSAFLTQADGALTRLYTACFAAGRDRCPIFHPNGADYIERDISTALHKLRASPLPVWTQGMLVPEIVTYEKVVDAMFSALYSPYQSFPLLAKSMAALMDGINTSALEYFLTQSDFECSDESCQYADCIERAELFPEAGLAFLNSDHTPDSSPERFAEISEILRQQSPLFGEKFQVDVASGWDAWPVQPRMKFTGPMGGRTRHPILFIGNTGDPVGPVQNAFDNARLFENAVVLVQDSVGHGSTSAPSSCTRTNIRRYFQTGQTPVSGVHCQVDWLPFEDVILDLDAMGQT